MGIEDRLAAVSGGGSRVSWAARLGLEDAHYFTENG